MTQLEIMETLGAAFQHGSLDALAPLLSETCIYTSEYSGKTFSGADKIIERMQHVHSNLDESTAYTYDAVSLKDIMQPDAHLPRKQSEEICEYALYLYQYGARIPVSVVVCWMADDKITRIVLSRDKTLFKSVFYGTDPKLEDDPNDLPSTVMPLTPHDRQVKNMRRAFSGQNIKDPELKSNLYIWRKSDEFMKQTLKNRGYEILESKIFSDCIGYRCDKDGVAYTVFMYAYGERQTTQLDGDYCSKLADLEFAKDSTILVMYLHATRRKDGDETVYEVLNYCDGKTYDFWMLDYIDDKPILKFYPRKEMSDLIFKLMYAFNHEDSDIYGLIISPHNSSYIFHGDSGYSMNSAIYSKLLRLHREHGDMKLAYMRQNDVIYSAVPYIEGVGFFGFKVDDKNKITDIYGEPFEGGRYKIEEFIKTDIREPEDLFDYIPALVEAKALTPVATERFALSLRFDNGEQRKYVLPIAPEDSEKEVVSYRRHVFSDGILASVSVVKSHKSEWNNYPDCGSAITFKNGFYISAVECYENSMPYSEPTLTDVVVYDDNKVTVKKTWEWAVNAIHEDEETGVIKVLIRGQAFNFYGRSTFASIDGRRLTSLTFDLIDSFNSGLVRVAIGGVGYGYMNADMQFVFPMKYDEADDFQDGSAKARLGDKWVTLKSDGSVLTLPTDSRYQEVCRFSEGMCRVSTLKLGMMDLAYHTDNEEVAGVWGFVNEAGEEVVAPQYIYAYDFEDGIAIVAKGEWTISPKWDNKYNQGRYWTETELWGGIDKTGREVIPCIFDEIKNFDGTTEYFMAHFGGWPDGKWGVINKRGEWIAQPVFEDFGYDYKDGLITFYAASKWSGPDDTPMGIYDLNQKKVLFEPQFLDVNFMDDGDISVEVYDKANDRVIEKIINRSGKERFASVYTSIYTWRNPYEVVIRDEDGDKHGLIDKNGNVLLPCEHTVSWNGIHYDRKWIVFEQDGKQGIKDFDGRIVIPPIYHEIYGVDNPFITVRVGEKDNYKEGMITSDGTVVIPAVYHRVAWTKDKKHIMCCKEGLCEMHEVQVK